MFEDLLKYIIYYRSVFLWCQQGENPILLNQKCASCFR
jgi:hypothetical protein